MEKEIKIEELNGIELLQLIYEEVKNNREDIQNVRKELNEKIDNTKNTLVAEIVEELNNFSVTTTRLINKLENKIENEIKARKEDVSKVKDFNRIIVNDIRSRVSILEEENEKYNLN